MGKNLNQLQAEHMAELADLEARRRRLQEKQAGAARREGERLVEESGRQRGRREVAAL